MSGDAAKNEVARNPEIGIFDPEEISAMILVNMKETAKVYHGRSGRLGTVKGVLPPTTRPLATYIPNGTTPKAGWVGVKMSR